MPALMSSGARIVLAADAGDRVADLQAGLLGRAAGDDVGDVRALADRAGARRDAEVRRA